MSKITLDDIVASYASVASINANFQEIEDVLNNDVLFRRNDTSEPNQMETELDMNSFRLYNLPTATEATDAVRYDQITDLIIQANTGLPPQTGHANEFLTTDGTAASWATLDSAVNALISDYASLRHYGTVAEAKAADLSVGEKLRIYGYTASGDMEPADYIVVAGGTGTDDGGYYHDMSNGNQLMLVADEYQVTWWGAKGDGLTDDTAKLQSALTASAGKKLLLTGRTYLISDALAMPINGVFLQGRGKLLATSDLAGASPAGHCLLDCTSSVGWKVDGVVFDMSDMTTFSFGARAIHGFQASRFEISNCEFYVGGAATALINCAFYKVLNNFVDVQDLSSTSRHDGVIDQWWGSHDFVIQGNRVRGNNIGEYGILVTGEQTTNVPASCYNFVISNNIVSGMIYDGIWVNGREAVNTKFSINNNIVENIRDFYGIAVTDCAEASVSDNVIRSTGLSGIRFAPETSAGGVTGCQYVTLSNNVVTFANTTVSADGDSGSSISVVGSATRNVTITGNIIRGSNHVHAINLGSGVDFCYEYGNIYDSATGEDVYDGSGTRTNRISYATYTPTITNVANLSSSTATISYTCSGTEVVGAIEIETTAALGATESTLRMSLPIVSSFTLDTDAIGSFSDISGNTGHFLADTTNNAIIAKFISDTASSYVFRGTFRYRIK